MQQYNYSKQKIMHTVHANKGLQQAALDAKGQEARDFSVSYPFRLAGSTAASFTGKLTDCSKKPTQKDEKRSSILSHQKKMGPTLRCYK